MKKRFDRCNQLRKLHDCLVDEVRLLKESAQEEEEGFDRDITILVTHGLFTGTLWQKLWTCEVKRISCTDTIPSVKERSSENIGTLSVLPFLCRHLQTRS